MKRLPMRPLALLPLATLVLAGCASNPAEDPVQVRLTDVDARLGNVERVISNQSLLELSRRIDALEAQQRELRGNGEVLQNTADGLGRQQRNLYADLDKRIAGLEAGLRQQVAAQAAAGAAGSVAGTPGAGTLAGAAAPAPGAAAAAGASGAPVDDQAAYAHALELLKAGDFANAIASFQAFMQAWPQSSLVDNAQYWIGEAYYVTRDFNQAGVAFRAVGERWPNSRKAGDALLKLGYTQAEQNHLADARATLGQVVQRFPGSDAARLAGERLQKLPADAH